MIVRADRETEAISVHGLENGNRAVFSKDSLVLETTNSSVSCLLRSEI